MCNIHFDEQAVRHAFETRSARDRAPLPMVDPEQIFRDVYPGLPIVGIRLHFVKKIKRAVVREAVRRNFEKLMKDKRVSLNEVPVIYVVEDMWGTRLSATEWTREQRRFAELVQEVQYDMMIEES